MATYHDALLIDDGRGYRHIMAGDISERGDLQLAPPEQCPSSWDTPPATLLPSPFCGTNALEEGTAVPVEVGVQEGLGAYGPGLHVYS